MSSGYKILLKYEVAYRQALASHGYDNNPATHPVYAVPCTAYPDPPAWQPRYRGIDRSEILALSDDEAELWTAGSPGGRTRYEATPATRFLREVQLRTGRDDGWVTEAANVLSAWNLLGPLQSDHEIVFCREDADPTASDLGAGYEFLGVDAAGFDGDNFSCICDALFFPRWHGTDPEGVLFLPYFKALNANGLFDGNAAAVGYRDFYLSLPWTEHNCPLGSIEVYSVDPGAAGRATGHETSATP